MTPRILVCIAGALLAVGSTAVTAQPLAEVARREKSRRADLAAKAARDAAPPKVYTSGAGRLTTGGAPSPSSADPEEATTAEEPAARPVRFPTRRRGATGSALSASPRSEPS